MFKEYIKDYIENEISYIEDCIEEDYKNKNTYKKDLNYLQKLKEKDIEEISDNVDNDNELWETIDEVIHSYIYHQKRG